MEIRQGAIERMSYRQSYQWDRYVRVFEHMAGVYSVPLQGAYNPPGYAHPQDNQYYQQFPPQQVMDPSSSIEKTCLGENVIEILSDKAEGHGDWNSPEFLDTTNSGRKKETKAMFFHKMETEEIVIDMWHLVSSMD
ncbi:hypothetical protein Tco_0927288 [Tanacetum coccineum]